VYQMPNYSMTILMREKDEFVSKSII
jgi:hypothetical protein